MNERTSELNQICRWVERFADNDGVVREKSRHELVRLGGPDVTRAVVTALIDPRTHVRWEAAKALEAIADPVSAPALMHALEDEDEDVRWVAAEGLIRLNKVGLLTVLSGLMKRARSTAFCTSAHHVLHEMNVYADLVAPVLRALEQSEPGVTVPPAAYHALVVLSTSGVTPTRSVRNQIE